MVQQDDGFREGLNPSTGCSQATPSNGNAMSANPDGEPTLEPDRLEAATDEAIAACGGDARAAVKALIVANEFLESEVCELMQAVS